MMSLLYVLVHWVRSVYCFSKLFCKKRLTLVTHAIKKVTK